MVNILVGAPIRQSPEVLKLFLDSLVHLENENLEIHYLFIDDNTDQLSHKILMNFMKDNSKVNIINYSKQSEEEYLKNDTTHIWTNSLIKKVALMKNIIIQKMLVSNYDYLLLADSDLILNPKTLLSLINAKKNIISEVFWTKWTPASMRMPQVWLQDEYNFFHKDEINNQEDIRKSEAVFVNKLKTPGVYEVGGLGALTLIKREVLEAGVNFSPLSNVSFKGEDRHFCIRAVAHGFRLYVDTHFPAIHLYRKDDVEKYSISNEIL